MLKRSVIRIGKMVLWFNWKKKDICELRYTSFIWDLRPALQILFNSISHLQSMVAFFIKHFVILDQTYRSVNYVLLCKLLLGMTLWQLTVLLHMKNTSNIFQSNSLILNHFHSVNLSWRSLKRQAPMFLAIPSSVKMKLVRSLFK